jgi:hypothetical protein
MEHAEKLAYLLEREFTARQILKLQEATLKVFSFMEGNTDSFFSAE